MFIKSALTPLLVLAALTLGSDAQNYCKGDFAKNAGNCKKFGFGVLGDCVNESNGTTFYNLSKFPPGVGFSDAKVQLKAELMTNEFEQGTTTWRYQNVENDHDQRGWTCGRIGFTTGTNDAYAVAKKFTSLVPNNPLAPLLPELERLSKLSFCDKAGRGDISNLGSFPDAWKKSACDIHMQNTQDSFTENMYMKPSHRFAALAGVTSNLGKAIFYDTIIQHGWQYTEPLINIYRLLELVGLKDSSESEKEYLLRFLNTREQMLCCNDAAWSSAADRTEDLRDVVNKGDLDMTGDVTLNRYGATITGDENPFSLIEKECPGSRSNDSKAPKPKPKKGKKTKKSKSPKH